MCVENRPLLAGTDELTFWYAQEDRMRTGILSENHRATVSVQFTIPTRFVVQQIGLFSALKDSGQQLP